MTFKRHLLILGLVCAGTLLAPGSAAATERVRSVFFSEFDKSTYEIDQGELVVFRNADPFLSHGVLADGLDLDGDPLFSAPVIGKGQTRLLRGAPFQPTGTYAFHCPIHPDMTATLEVNSSGTPLPEDLDAPSVGLKVPISRTRQLRKRRVPVRFNVGEAQDLHLAVRVAGVKVGTRDLTFFAGTKRTTIFNFPKATARKIGRAIRRARSRGKVKIPVKVSSSAVDAAGNEAKRSVARRLSLP